MTNKIVHTIGSDFSDPFFLEQLVEFDAAFFPRPWAKKEWEGCLNTEHLISLLLDENNKLIGYSLYFINGADSFAHLYKIQVNPAFRGQKLGQELFLTTLKELEQRGFKEFFLEVEAENTVAQNLYLKNGFQIIHRKKKFYSDGQDALILTKSS